MRFVSALLLAAATAVAAAGSDDIGALVAQIPACAFDCLNKAAAASGCSVTDYKCMCSKMLQNQNEATTCLTNACQVEDMSKLASVTSDICKAVGATGGTATSTAKAGGGTAAATGGAPGTPSGGGGAAATTTGTPPVPAGAGRSVSVAAVGVVGLAVVAAAALVA